MKDKTSTVKELVEGFLWSIFIGVVGISIGLGALYPPLNYVAKPFVCPAGQMTFEKHVDQATLSQTFYSADWYCTKGEAATQSESDRLPISPFVSAGVFFCFSRVGITSRGRKRLTGKKLQSSGAKEVLSPGKLYF